VKADPKTEWQKFLAESAAAGTDRRSAREAAVRRFHERRREEQSRVDSRLGESNE